MIEPFITSSSKIESLKVLILKKFEKTVIDRGYHEVCMSHPLILQTGS